VKRRFQTVVLENRHLTVTVCPQLGPHILNVVDLAAGRALLYEGEISYSGDILKCTGSLGGGLHVNHPYYHSGSGGVIPFSYAADTMADGTARLVMAGTAYPHLQRMVITVRLKPDEAILRLGYRFESLAPWPMGFNPWINAACSARGDVQFVLPARWVSDHWFGINAKELEDGRYFRLTPWPVDERGSDRSFLRNAGSLTAFTYGRDDGFSGIYHHGDDAGFVRIADPQVLAGAKAWGQWTEKSRAPWCELWGAFSHNMEDPLWIGPFESRAAEESLFPVSGIGGITWACENGAVCLRREEGTRLSVGISVPRDHGPCSVRVTADGVDILQSAATLAPGHSFRHAVEVPPTADQLRIRVLDASGMLVLEYQRFLAPRPEAQFAMPETPWNRRTLLAEALWQEAFTPMMDWGPWYQPVQTYRKACEREPANAAYLVGLARALLKDAEPDLFRSARSTPNSDKIAEARGILAPLASSAGPERYGAACLLGLAEMAAGRPEAAAAALGPLVDTPGDSTAVRLGLGLLGVQTGRMDAASAHARKAVGLSPDSTLPRHLLALALLKQGMAAPAAAALAPCRAADRLDAGTLELLRRAALAGEDAARAGELARELERLRGCAGRQYEADMVRLGALEAGRLPDPRAIDTRRGEAVPGDAVGE
jgi:hypothetical protein